MAAILRTGKFLRFVSGITRYNNSAQTSPQVAPGIAANPFTYNADCTLVNVSDTQFPFQVWSLHHLQGALPALAAAAADDRQEEPPPPQDGVGVLQHYEPLTAEAATPSNASSLKSVTQSHKPTTRAACGRIQKGLNKNEVLGFDAITPAYEQLDKSITFKASRVSSKPPIEASASATTDAEAKNGQTGCSPASGQETMAKGPTVVPHVEAAAGPTADAAQPTSCWPDSPMLPLVKVFDNVSSQTSQWYPLPWACQMFREQGRISDLENLLHGSRGIRKEDRKCIFWWTLRCYVDFAMVHQALDLFDYLQCEGLDRDFDEFHQLMTSFMPSLYCASPAILPDVSPSPLGSATPPTAASSEHSCTSARDSSAHLHRQLKKALAKKQVAESLAAYRELEQLKKPLNVTDLSTLIELLVKGNLLVDATQITSAMLQNHTYPLPKVFRFLLNRLAAQGEVQLMNVLGDQLSTSVRKEVSFDNRLCNAYLAADRAKEYLNILEQSLTQSGPTVTDEQLQHLKDRFPRGGAMGLLENNPDLVEQFTKLAEKYLSLGFVAPINVLWTYHFISGRYDVAADLWSKHVKNCPKVMFQKVCHTARSTGNAELAERLVDLLKAATVTRGARGIAYSCLLDVLTKKQEYLAGLRFLNQAVDEGISLQDINQTALKRLKDGLEKNCGASFPFPIPAKSLCQTASSEEPTFLSPEAADPYDPMDNSRALAVMSN